MTDAETITPEILLKAYSIGVFPMAESAEDEGLFWVEPKERGIIPLDDFHIPKRLNRTIRHRIFDMKVNTAFHEVVEHCANRKDKKDTWINKRIKDLYFELFKLGFCHSVESWNNGKLVGGLYGVALGGAFFGESMFSTEADASKVALVHLVQRLQKRGFTLLDTQFNTEHLQQFGAITIPQAEYLKLLEVAIQKEAAF